MKIYDAILKFFTPFIKWFGGLHFPFTHKKVTGRHYYLLRDKINIGTVLLTKTYGELSNLINPEKMKHAAIYVGDVDGTGVRYVVEAVGRGVVKTDLVTFLTTKDLILGCEAKYLRANDRAVLQKEALSIVGIPYDYLFNKGGEAFYCFEAVAHILKMVRPEIRLKTYEVVKGKLIYGYETFLDEKYFEITFDSNKV